MELSTGVANLTIPALSSIESNMFSLGAQLFLQCLKQRVFEKQNPSGLSAHLLKTQLSEPKCDRPRTVTVEQGPKREKWWDGCGEKWCDGCGALVSLDSKLRKN
jgi:hypothetical protein